MEEGILRELGLSSSDPGKEGRDPLGRRLEA